MIPENNSVGLARLFANVAHTAAGTLYGGKPYVVHLDAAHQVAADFRLMLDIRRATYLHDVLEDTPITYDMIAETFGEPTAILVEAVTGRGPNRAARNADAHAKIGAVGIRAVLVKLCDRIANAEASEPCGGYWNLYRDEHAEFETLLVPALASPHCTEFIWQMLRRLRRALGLSEVLPGEPAS